MDGTAAGPAAASVCPENDGGGGEDGALWFFLPVLVLMALWISWGKAGRLARTGELFFLLLAAAAATVVGLALFQVKGENLLPLWTEPAAQTLYAALPVSGVLGYGLYAAFPIYA